MSLGNLAGSVGRGMAAGLVGTGVMTLVQMIEMKLQDREASTAPADAFEKVMGVKPRSESAEQRLTQVVHFAYGTGWGAVRGLLGGAGLPAALATPAHLGMVWGAAAVMLPRLDIAPPVRAWGAKGIAKDVMHHAVYAVATGLAYEWLERRTR